jgi:membrane protein DedA with SNARE-associated domain
MQHLTPELTKWVVDYGNFGLFVLLAIGIIGLPIPEETLMIFAGYLIAENKWSALPTLITAISGSICGITVSYALGISAGNRLIQQYGYLIGITDSKIQYAQHWFNQIGKWSLFFGYFILGVRHLTGYIAGSFLLRYKHFALFAYTGAVVWATSFVSLGYFFHDNISHILQYTNFDVFIAGLLIVVFLAFILYHWIQRHYHGN